MKHFKALTFLSLFFVMSLIMGYGTTGARVYDNHPMPKPVLITDQLEIQFETDVDVNRLTQGSKSLSLGVNSLDATFAKHNIREAEKMFPWRKGKDAIVDYNDMSKMYLLRLPVTADYEAVVDDLKKNPYVRSVNPVYAMPLDVNANDPNFLPQWGLKIINDTAAWNIEKGSEEAIIAIADAGVLYNHPDLIDNIWVNPGEDLDNDGVVFDPDDVNSADDDGNGIADDLIGYDFFSGLTGLTIWPGEDAGTPDIDPKDFNGHGTHCAGIAAMVSNNNSYGAGVAGGWGGGNGPNRGPRIMCLRIGASAEHPDYGYETGYINSYNAAQAIDYAANNGACAVNCSWGSSNASGMDAALAQANINGMVVIHSAGNDDTQSTTGGYMDNYFYGGYEVAMSVAATTNADTKAGFSNFGPYVDLSAPGVNIYSTYSAHYGVDADYLSGTSMSSPMVVGLAALIKSKMPAWDKFEIDTVIKNHTDDIDAINPDYAGFLGTGRINAYNSIATLPDPRFEAVGDLVGPAPLTVQFNDLSPNSPSSWEWDFGDGGSSFDQNPEYTYNDPGLYDVSLTITEPRGTTAETLHRLVMVTADTVKVDSIMVPPSATDQQVVLPIYLSNTQQNRSFTVPVQAKMDGAIPPAYQKIVIDSISVVDTRIDHFELKQISPFNDFTHIYGFVLNSDISGGSNYLHPGSGLVLNAYFTIDGGLPNGTVFTFDSISSAGQTLELNGIYYDYVPEFVPGKIVVYAPYICGDVDNDQKIDLLDILYLIDYKFKDGPAPESLESADVNMDGNVNLLDILYLIEYKFKDGPAPCES